MINWLLGFIPLRCLVSHLERRANIYLKQAQLTEDAMDSCLTEREISRSLKQIKDDRERRGRYYHDDIKLPKGYTTLPDMEQEDRDFAKFGHVFPSTLLGIDGESQYVPDQFCNNCQQWGHAAAICTNPTSLPILEIPDDEPETR